MIEYIDARLRLWGRWAISRLDGGAGEVAMFDYGEPKTARYCSVPLIEDQCLSIGAAVDWLGTRRAELAQLVQWHYRDGVAYPATQLAAMLHVSERVYWYRLERAQIDILGWLMARESHGTYLER